MQLKHLENYKSDLLNITDREERMKHKYVFQTDLTADTINERIRSPFAMWAENETFIDNNIQQVLDRISDYYGE